MKENLPVELHPSRKKGRATKESPFHLFDFILMVFSRSEPSGAKVVSCSHKKCSTYKFFKQLHAKFYTNEKCGAVTTPGEIPATARLCRIWGHLQI